MFIYTILRIYIYLFVLLYFDKIIDYLDVMSELSKLQPEEGLEEFRKETEYLENKVRQTLLHYISPRHTNYKNDTFRCLL